MVQLQVVLHNENCKWNPKSPYAIGKALGARWIDFYRQSEDSKLFSCYGILFNHSGPRRGEAFVEQKICKAAVRIKLGLQHTLELGSVYPQRDFGHSKDYVRAMHLILQQDSPGDYVVATGVTKSVFDIVSYVFEKLDLDIEYLKTDRKHSRPNELDYLKGDSTKIRQLGWQPVYTFETMLDEMIFHCLNNEK